MDVGGLQDSIEIQLLCISTSVCFLVRFTAATGQFLVS